MANYRASKFAPTNFPPRNESFDFRAQLEAKYRDGLRRAPLGSYADAEGAVVWTQEYLRYHLGQCSPAVVLDKVQRQIRGEGLPGPCGSGQSGVVGFPPRDETHAFRLDLERVYRDDLNRSLFETRVDLEGDVVWIQEYLRYRLNGCDHGQRVLRIMQQIDARGNRYAILTGTWKTLRVSHRSHSRCYYYESGLTRWSVKPGQAKGHIPH